MDAQQIRDWFLAPRKPLLPARRVMELYFTFHPRTSFLKNLPRDSKVVDIGAGDGSLSVFVNWPAPERSDLELHAYSIEKGASFDKFKSYELSDWNVAPPEFQGRRFDAVVCAHFIEHIADPQTFIDWAARKLNPGGRIYLEWPSPASLELPSRTELVPLGVDLMISAFHDDASHRELPDMDAISAACVASGFKIECRGIVRLPWLEDEMLAHFRKDADGFPRQAAFWSRTGWSQYLILQLGA